MGAYRGDDGKPFVLNSVRKAEKLVLEKSFNHEYAGIAGMLTMNNGGNGLDHATNHANRVNREYAGHAGTYDILTTPKTKRREMLLAARYLVGLDCPFRLPVVMALWDQRGNTTVVAGASSYCSRLAKHTALMSICVTVCLDIIIPVLVRMNILVE